MKKMLTKNIRFNMLRLFYSMFLFYRFLEWIQCIGNVKLLEQDPVVIYKQNHLCHNHFDASSFTNNNLKRLKMDAIPSLLNSFSLSDNVMAAYRVEMSLWKGE